MPEGPEAKIASDYFNTCFKKSKQLKFKIISDYYTKNYLEVFNMINNNLPNSCLSYTVGKNIFIDLKNNQIFNFHLGMTGGWSTKLVKHCHFKIYDNNKVIFFKDVRKFGKMKIIKKLDFNEKFQPIYDILNSSYNLKKHLFFLEKKVNKNKSICSTLMNQKFFPGVGNYIKSESLYQSRIHPEEKWGNINLKMKNILIKNTKDIMLNSYDAGGAELKDFKNPFSESDFQLKIYGKKYTEKNNPVTSILTSDSRKSWICLKSQKLIKNG
ncbi:MAG: hypothetical protein CMP49_00110 [Flavobacteriales bacterium]|nr:hypothetical protein [Flavobacteriales bacterium]|tara:strand:- start:25059 stop:25865 length:807 start_codon:yes stop_codon:yes gene_type:complete